MIRNRYKLVYGTYLICRTIPPRWTDSHRQGLDTDKQGITELSDSWN